ncbi:MAG TPA: response regulator [Rhizobacter sp.]|nr:response regulator [Rhizobacter sp.]
MERAPHILVVDDDVEIQKLTKRHLQEFGFLVTVAGNGREMFRALKDWRIDLIVLDVLMPGQDGFALCKEVRNTSQLPIIMLTALRDEADRVIGLELGADDYLVKPFGPRELMARIKAVLRRSQSRGTEAQGEAAPVAYSFVGWRLNVVARELQARDGTVVPLSTREFSLLTTFLEHPRRPLSREQLADMVAGRDCPPFDRSIDILVSRLRRKVEDAAAKEPALIKTVRGEGYQLCADVMRHHRHAAVG